MVECALDFAFPFLKIIALSWEGSMSAPCAARARKEEAAEALKGVTVTASPLWKKTNSRLPFFSFFFPAPLSLLSTFARDHFGDVGLDCARSS